MFPNAAAAAPHMDTGRLRALAVSSARPSALAPGLPTIAAAGLPGYESAFAVGMFAPARTPPAIISRLHQEAVRALNSAEVKSRLFNVGVEVVASSPDELAASMKTEMARIGKMIKDAGIRAD
jgi:tripartite-type tricarboxylate transporter receptor subunit TctC